MKNSREVTLHDLFIIKLQSLYNVESEIIKALPKMIKKATNADLKQGLEEHLAETKGHAERLEEIFQQLGEKPKKLKVEAIRGLVEDAKWVMENVKNPEALDAALIAAAQYVEHYEMAGYGTAVEWAKLMNHTGAEELLQETLDEEKAADEKLSKVAVTEVNDAVDMGMEITGNMALGRV